MTIILSLSGVTACTAEAIKRGMYQGLYHKQCMDEARMPDCNPQHRSYDDYERERETALQPRAE